MDNGAVEPWMQEVLEQARHLGVYSIGPVPIAEKPLPTNGTIFTGRFPEGTKGGIGAELLVHPLDNIFRGYKGHVNLARDNDFIEDNKILRGIQPGSFGRFVVSDYELGTAHSVTDRNWYHARLLRPANRSDIGRQVVVSPNDFEMLVMSAIAEQTSQSGFERARIFDGVISADYQTLLDLPFERVGRVYRHLKGIPVEEENQ